MSAGGAPGSQDLSPEAAGGGNLWGCALPAHVAASVWVLGAGQGLSANLLKGGLAIGVVQDDAQDTEKTKALRGR